MNAIEMIGKCEKIIVYGAKLGARDAVMELSGVYPDKLLGCAVTDTKGNIREVLGYPVKLFAEYAKADDISRKNTCVVVATLAKFHREITDYVSGMGFTMTATWDDILEVKRSMPDDELIQLAKKENQGFVTRTRKFLKKCRAGFERKHE